MLQNIKDLPAGVVGLKATGKITKEDHRRVFEPLVHQARREGRRLRLLFHLGAAFEGFTVSAAWEDAKIGLRAIRLFDGCAIVSDLEWVRASTQFVSYLMPCPVQLFRISQRDEAVAWLGTQPEAASHRLLPEVGVMVVAIKQAPRAQDFDSLSLTADTWIEAQGELQGLVLHMPVFPGWENFGSIIRHAQFIRDHHRKVKRVALSANSKLAELLPQLVEYFMKAEVETFTYDELDRAIQWAGEPTA